MTAGVPNHDGGEPVIGHPYDPLFSPFWGLSPAPLCTMSPGVNPLYQPSMLVVGPYPQQHQSFGGPINDINSDDQTIPSLLATTGFNVIIGYSKHQWLLQASTKSTPHA